MATGPEIPDFKQYSMKAAGARDSFITLLETSFLPLKKQKSGKASSVSLSPA
jgi:hypothetical protein